MRWENDALRSLEKIATTPARKAILVARKARESSRRRQIACPACGEAESYTNRGKDDVCANCLLDMWNAADAAAAAVSAERGDGIVAVAMAISCHNLPYPHLAADHDEVPAGAVFDRTDSGGSWSRQDTASSTMQKLFHEFMVGMAKVAPVAHSEGRMRALLSGGDTLFNGDKITAYLPEVTVQTAEALWCFVVWHSNNAYRQGFERGSDLLRRLNDGTLTQDGFDADILKRKADLQGEAIEAAAGGFNNRR